MLEGVYKDDGEAWPYNSMACIVTSWVGDLSLTIYDEATSNKAGNDVAGYLSKHDCANGSKTEKKKKSWGFILFD